MAPLTLTSLAWAVLLTAGDQYPEQDPRAGQTRGRTTASQEQPDSGSTNPELRTAPRMLYERSGGILGDSLNFQFTADGRAVAEEVRFGETRRATGSLSLRRAQSLEQQMAIELQKVRIAIWDCDADEIHYHFGDSKSGAQFTECDPDPQLAALIDSLEAAAAEVLDGKSAEQYDAELRVDLPDSSPVAAVGFELRGKQLQIWRASADGQWSCGGAIEVKPEEKDVLLRVVREIERSDGVVPLVHAHHGRPSEKEEASAYLDLRQAQGQQLLRERPDLASFLRTLIERS